LPEGRRLGNFQGHGNDSGAVAPLRVVTGHDVSKKGFKHFVKQRHRFANGTIVVRHERIGGPGRIGKETGNQELQQRPRRMTQSHHGQGAVGSRQGRGDLFELLQNGVAGLQVIKAQIVRRRHDQITAGGELFQQVPVTHVRGGPDNGAAQKMNHGAGWTVL